MRGLTIRQPWATLVTTPRRDAPDVPLKEYETRKARLLIRGTIVVSAGRRWDEPQRDFVASPRFKAALEEIGAPAYMLSHLATAPLGMILGVVDIVDSLPASNLGETRPEPWVAELTEAERTLGDFGLGRHGWKLRNPRPLIRPFPAIGALGFWTVPDAAVAEIVRQLGSEAIR